VSEDLVERHLREAADAASHERTVRIVMWDGTTVQGVPTRVHEDSGGAAAAWPSMGEESLDGAPDLYIMVGEVRVPAAEITSLEILSEGAGGLR
jgi:hypothetical protein